VAEASVVTSGTDDLPATNAPQAMRRVHQVEPTGPQDEGDQMSNNNDRRATAGRRRYVRGIAALAALAFVAAACGSSNDTTVSSDAAPAPTDTEPVDTAPPTEVPASTEAPADTTPTTEAAVDTTPASTEPATTEPATTEPAIETAAACAAEVEMKTPGAFTVRTWFDFGAGDLSGFSAFEGGVLYAVVEELGFSEADVVFEVEEGLADGFFIAGETTFDVGISVITITEGRAETIDFSDSYYDVEQVLVGREDSPVAGAASVADISGASLGTFSETASLALGASEEYVAAVIAPSSEPVVYPSIWEDTPAAQTALDDGTVDALVIDVPSALYAIQPDGLGMQNVGVVAVLPRQDDPFEQLGMVVQKASPLVDCVNQALATLADDGTIAELENQWLHGGAAILTE